MIKDVATRGYSIGTIALVALRGYAASSTPPAVADVRNFPFIANMGTLMGR